MNRSPTPYLPDIDTLLDGSRPTEWEATPAPPVARSLSSTPTEYCEWEATPAPSVGRPTPTPTTISRETSLQFREFSVVSGIESQSQNTGRRSYLSASEKVSVVRWLYSHRQMYADKNTSRTAFWKSCADYIESEMGKNYRHIDRVAAKWEKSRRNEIEKAKMESGVAKSDTD